MYDYTTKCFIDDEVPFYLVVEPQEYNDYARKYGRYENIKILQLPENDPGLIFVRNWIRDHSQANGDKRHWQIDDNIVQFFRRYNTQRVQVDSGIALRVCEDFTDRYLNIGISGLQYEMFAVDYQKQPPIMLNQHVYSMTLFLNELPYRWRPPANEDVDMCLQVLSSGYWCTLLFGAFVGGKKETMKIKGGQTDTEYAGDGRLKMARALERKWPGVVSVTRRYGKPQHLIKANWLKFDTQLIRDPSIDWEALEKGGSYNYGMVLRAKKDVVKGRELKQIYDEIGEKKMDEE